MHEPPFTSQPTKQERHAPVDVLKVLQVGSTPWHLPSPLRKNPLEHFAQRDPLKVLQLGSKLLLTIPGRQVSSISPNPGQQDRHPPVNVSYVLQFGLTGWQILPASRQYRVEQTVHVPCESQALQPRLRITMVWWAVSTTRKQIRSVLKGQQLMFCEADIDQLQLKQSAPSLLYIVQQKIPTDVICHLPSQIPKEPLLDSSRASHIYGLMSANKEGSQQYCPTFMHVGAKFGCLMQYGLQSIFSLIDQDGFICLMSVRWRIYFLTLVSYAVTHALRTMWSALKSTLTTAPFNYQLAYLGTIDMVVLFVIAIFMNILGSKVEKWGAKKALVLTLAALLIFNTLIGVFLNLNLTAQWLYVVFFGIGVGIASSTAWPCCLYMVSLYFDKSKGITLSAWNGTSQLGDFISLGSFFIIVAADQWQPQSCFFLGSLYLLIMLILVVVLIPNKLKEEKKDGAQPNPQEAQKEEEEEGVQEGHVELKEEVLEVNDQQHGKKLECISQGSEQETTPKHQAKSGQEVQQAQKNTGKRVNILTVWKLPGVAMNVLAYGFIKSVNAFIVSWMVFYLISLDLGSEAVLVTILWSLSVFIGGLLCGFINRKLSKLFFVFQLMAATVAFIFLEELHYNIYQVEIIVSLVLCGLFYGGPYSLMSTAIPISLGSQPAVQQYQNGMSAIISLVEGYGMFFCGISLLLLPFWGIEQINLVAACYCGAAILLLLAQMYRDRMKSEAREEAKLHAKSPLKEQPRPQEKDTPFPLEV